MNISAEPVERVISLGTNCLTATLLQSIGLKSASYPFDWIFSNSEIVTHCLDDDFTTFLDPEQYRSMGDGRCYHALYGPMRGGSAIFNHRDPTQVDDFTYLKRCVERFRDALASSGRTLFVLIREASEIGETTHQFYAVKEALDRRSATASLLFLTARPGAEVLGQPAIIAACGTSALIEVGTHAGSDGVRFTNRDDHAAVARVVRLSCSNAQWLPAT